MKQWSMFMHVARSREGFEYLGSLMYRSRESGRLRQIGLGYAVLGSLNKSTVFDVIDVCTGQIYEPYSLLLSQSYYMAVRHEKIIVTW